IGHDHRREAETVTALAPPPAGRLEEQRSADDGETAGRADLFPDRELDLEEAHSLQLTRPVEPADVNCLHTASLDSIDETRFRIGIVTRNQNCGRHQTHLLRVEGPGK